MKQKSEEYFSSLNYTLANEDTGFEFALLKKHKAENIVSVCGSGGRALPLIGPSTKHLHCVDLVQEQLYLASLRKEAIIKLSFEEYLSFFGFPPQHLIPSKHRKLLFEKLKLQSDCKSFFLGYFSKNEWRPLIYDGKWEKTFKKISQLVRTVVGKEIWKLFDFDDVNEQRDWVKDHFPYKRWSLVLKTVGNATFFNALLYRGSFVKKNIDVSYFDFYKNAYDSLFLQAPARENFFLQLSFLGKIYYSEGAPIEAHKKCFNQMKAGLENGCKVTLVQKNLIEYLENLPSKSVDFASLSDVPSYFQGELENSYMNRISKSLRPGALVVLRSYLHVPENTDTSLYTEVSSKFEKEILAEKTQMYKIQVFQKL